MIRELTGLMALLLAGNVAAQGLIDVLKKPSIQTIASYYQNYDWDQDGVREINGLTLMDFEPAQMNGSGSRGLAIVLVEPRLLSASSTSQNLALKQRLQRHRDQLITDGFQTRFFLADVYAGPLHQDGKTVLALRRFLKDVHRNHPSLKGVTLVGAFPEASLVRRVLSKKTPIPPETGPDEFGLEPERINPRADLVLADLDGQWESLYRQTMSLEYRSIEVPPDQSPSNFPSDGQSIFGRLKHAYQLDAQDIFYLQDDFSRIEATPLATGVVARLVIDSKNIRNPELATADLAMANPIARPEIMVSRLDARGIAVNPVGPLDVHGLSPLNAQGQPQTLTYMNNDGVSQTALWIANPNQRTHDSLIWERDTLLEQRVLLDYFDRNSAHRTGQVPAFNYRVASINQLNSGLVSPDVSNFSDLTPADPGGFGSPIAISDAGLIEYVNFLKTPAILRAVIAHSNGLYSAFDNHANDDTSHGYYPNTEMAIGGGPMWAWDKFAYGSTQYIRPPSARRFKEKADWAFSRSLWENRTLLYSGSSFFLHHGCGVNVPDSNLTTPRTSIDYGFMNNADSVLFFQNGLSALVRGKVFYDVPTGFGQSIRTQGGQFAAAWRNAHYLDANNATLKPITIGDRSKVLGHKKSYFWSLRGDWTLRLRYP